MSDDLRCTVAARRRALGEGAGALAARVGVSRQALSAIEAGRAVPSTAVALRLAAALGCRVEDLFALAGGEAPTGDLPAGARIVAGEVAGRWAALAAPDGVVADGMADGRGGVAWVEDPGAVRRQALIMGCSPALGLLASLVTRGGAGAARAVWLPADSTASLAALAAGRVHVAGLHLAADGDAATHDAMVRAAVPDEDVLIVRLHGWREGLVTAPGNPLGLRSAADLPGRRVARRGPGAGATVALREALTAAGVQEVDGPLVDGHDDAAGAVRWGAADAAVVVEPVAARHGLPFLPLRVEAFELVLRARDLDHPGVRAVLDVLAGARLAREIGGQRGYDVSGLGAARRRGAA